MNAEYFRDLLSKMPEDHDLFVFSHGIILKIVGFNGDFVEFQETIRNDFNQLKEMNSSLSIHVTNYWYLLRGNNGTEKLAQ